MWPGLCPSRVGTGQVGPGHTKCTPLPAFTILVLLEGSHIHSFTDGLELLLSQSKSLVVVTEMVRSARHKYLLCISLEKSADH